PRQKDWTMRHQHFLGPRFDLPLQNITWSLYVPRNYHYYDFAGTLNPDERTTSHSTLADFSYGSYMQSTQAFNDADLRRAVELQNQGLQFAKQGRQSDARQALIQAKNFAANDGALNEDARVNLR